MFFVEKPTMAGAALVISAGHHCNKAGQAAMQRGT